MPAFRSLKKDIRTMLEAEDWREQSLALDSLPATSLIGPLFACLPQGEPITSRAAALLGHQVGRLADQADGKEQVANIIRRLIWHMNEDSGNIGWGIPEAYGAIMAERRDIANLYCRVLFSYVFDTGRKADNYCEHIPLRRSCYKGIKTLVLAFPDLKDISGLGAFGGRALAHGAENDPDPECRDMAKECLEIIKKARG